MPVRSVSVPRNGGTALSSSTTAACIDVADDAFARGIVTSSLSVPAVGPEVTSAGKPKGLPSEGKQSATFVRAGAVPACTFGSAAFRFFC